MLHPVAFHLSAQSELSPASKSISESCEKILRGASVGEDCLAEFHSPADTDDSLVRAAQLAANDFRIRFECTGMSPANAGAASRHRTKISKKVVDVDFHELFISHRRRSSDGLFLQSNPSGKRTAHHHATRYTSCSRRHKGFVLNQTAAQTRLAARTSENCERTRSRILTSRESFARSALSQAQRLWTRGLADALGILRE